MNHTGVSLVTVRWLALLIAVVMFEGNAFARSKYEVIHRFHQGGNVGHRPTDLIADKSGNLYGTTFWGGKYNFGTVFEMTPDKNGAWTTTALYSFPSGSSFLQSAGAGSLILDQAGNLYGITDEGGALQDGTVFQLKPPKARARAWTETDIYTFSGWNGFLPEGLALDSAGNLYGTTLDGGRYCQGYGCGLVYELTRPPNGHGTWKRTTLYYFKGVLGNKKDGDGAQPTGVVFGPGGILYGGTNGGGNCSSGCNGTVFELKPPAKRGGRWHEAVLYRFPNWSEDGVSGVVLDKEGAIYGALATSVYQLKLKDGVWRYTDLHDFDQGSEHGFLPVGVIVDNAGNLYGTAASGGYSLGYGVAFRLTPRKYGQWMEIVLHQFAGGNDGIGPWSGLMFGGNGLLYGTTMWGGNEQCNLGSGIIGCGTVFSVAP